MTAMAEENRKGGAPSGNQYARKHGFYSRVLDEDEQRDLEEAREIEGISEEICLLRAKIKSILRHDPENINLIMTALSALARLVRAHYNISAGDKKGIREAVGNVLRDVALPLGIDIFRRLKG
jgi:hypothetical protein